MSLLSFLILFISVFFFLVLLRLVNSFILAKKKKKKKKINFGFIYFFCSFSLFSFTYFCCNFCYCLLSDKYELCSFSSSLGVYVRFYLRSFFFLKVDIFCYKVSLSLPLLCPICFILSGLGFNLPWGFF